MYPTFEQYNTAMQFPNRSLNDSVLKQGTVERNGLGIPLAACGGFALTYTVHAQNNNKYAVRCFHKQSNALEQRYKAISEKIKSLNSSYFVNFEFQPNGINIDRMQYPIVKMEWVAGKTLGQFLEANYRSKNKLLNIEKQLLKIAQYLEGQKIAHGDLQPGNIMVVDSEGNNLKLIDYDGMFVEDIAALRATENGHINFQHPGRRINNPWNFYLDRFSVITMIIALRALSCDANIWVNTNTDSDSLVFKHQDYTSPETSQVFKELSRIESIKTHVENLAKICKSEINNIPKAEDFLQGIRIPSVSLNFNTTINRESRRYVGVYTVVDALEYQAAEREVGNIVELVGCVYDVKYSHTRNGHPYIFVNFDDWHNDITKLTIWSEGLDELSRTPQKVPSEHWKGKWISVKGLLDPPYTSNRYGYTHISITISKQDQIQVISEEEAKYRLGRETQTVQNTQRSNVASISSSLSVSRPSNSAVVQSMNTMLPGKQGRQPARSHASTIPSSQPPRPRSRTNRHVSQTQYTPVNRNTSSSTGCFIWLVLIAIVILALLLSL